LPRQLQRKFVLLSKISSLKDCGAERLRPFERLVAERSADVYALLYRLTSDAEEARDLTQETFLRAFQSVSRFRGDADLKTWIYRIAINQARNRWRWWKRRRRDVTVSLDDNRGPSEQPLSASLRNEDAPDPSRKLWRMNERANCEQPCWDCGQRIGKQ